MDIQYPASLVLHAAYRRACDTDKAQVNGWAQEQFSGWGSKWKYLWPDWLYKDAAFQQVYTEQRFQKRSDDLFKLLKDHARLYSILPDFLQQRRSSGIGSQLSSAASQIKITIKLLSIGCGPGVDAVALMACLHSLIDNSICHITFDVTLVDAAAGWEGKAMAAVKAAGAGRSVMCLLELLCYPHRRSHAAASLRASYFRTSLIFTQ